jgi:carotenoid cleavage dioxygenase
MHAAGSRAACLHASRRALRGRAPRLSRLQARVVRNRVPPPAGARDAPHPLRRGLAGRRAALASQAAFAPLPLRAARDYHASMTAYDSTQDPYLQGAFAPTQSELDSAPATVVAGELPHDLQGTYSRNGPNPRFPPLGSYTYPLDGDGMIHAVRFEGGRASYTNRYVRTPSIAAEERAGRALWGGVMTPVMPPPEEAGELNGQYKDLPDINVVRHGGRLLALAEGGRPFEMTPQLATVGPYYFGGKLAQGICAHPKIDPLTGEMIAFRYAFEKPFLSWSVIDRDGNVSRAEQPIDIDAPYMIHDCALTRSYLVLFVCPAPFDLASAEVLRWAPERGTRIALVPRDGSEVAWIDTEAFWVWHFANAFDEVDANGATTVVVDYPVWSALPLGPSTATGHVARARIDPVQRRVAFDTIDTRMAEFPRIDDRRLGTPHRYFYCAGKDEEMGRGAFNRIRRYDARSGESVEYAPERGRVGEPVFAPSSNDPGESAGYVLTYVYDGDTTDVAILRAADLAGDPVCVLRMPQRVPMGLHGCWVASGAS